MDVRTARPHRVLVGVSLVAAPLMTAASTFFWDEGRYGVPGGTLLALAGVFWVYGLVGLFGVARTRMPVYGSVGLLVALFGCFGGIAFGLQGFYEGVFAVSGETSLKALARYPIAANVVLWIPGPLFPLSVFGLGVALRYIKIIPLWVGILLCAAGVTFPLSRIPRIDWIAHLVDVLLLVPFAYLGVLAVLGAGWARPVESAAVSTSPPQQPVRES